MPSRPSAAFSAVRWRLSDIDGLTAAVSASTCTESLACTASATAVITSDARSPTIAPPRPPPPLPPPPARPAQAPPRDPPGPPQPDHPAPQDRPLGGGGDELDYPVGPPPHHRPPMGPDQVLRHPHRDPLEPRLPLRD